MAHGKEIAKKHLEILVRNKGFEFTDTFFPYTSGEIGPYYIQSIVIEKNGKDYHQAIKDMAGLISENVKIDDSTVISGGESRDWDFSNPVAYELKLPHAKIYKNGKVLGADMKDKRVTLVADLNNEGSSPRDLWMPAIQNKRGKGEHIFFYVDRMENGPKVMKELGLQSYALVPLDNQAWNYLLKNNVISPEIYKNLEERGTTKEARDFWARKMLKSDKGFETLKRLFNNPDTKQKAMKIIEKGYPEMELRKILEK
jgi:orotate phosphoribosyltransferase